jgi:hypothetical protein
MGDNNGMSKQQYASIVQQGYKVTGNTFPVKDQLKALGCVWGPMEKCWYAPTEEIQVKAWAIVDARKSPSFQGGFRLPSWRDNLDNEF